MMRLLQKKVKIIIFVLWPHTKTPIVFDKQQVLRHRLSTKHEILNPKQIQMIKIQNSKRFGHPSTSLGTDFVI